MKRHLCVLLLVAVCLPATAGAQNRNQPDEPAVTCIRLSDRAAVFHVAGGEPTMVTALKSEAGIVVVDTERSPVFAAAIRRAIEAEFSGDIAYLINTHGHGDHTWGNQVFADALIIAHENCADEMHEADQRREGTVEQIQAMLPRWRSQYESLEAGSEAAVSLAATIAYYEQMAAGLGSGFTLTLPEVTFSDRLHLDLGDLTLELTWYGGAHSRSDIVIYCPEEQLLLTGDLFYSGGMPTYIDSERIPYLDRWHETIEALLQRPEGITRIVTGHEESLPVSELAATRDFIAEQQARFAGRESTLNLFRETHESAGLEPALTRLRAMYADSTRYYTLRPELDTYAYRLMLAEKLDEALQIFLVMAELWPDAYISWDSLGEVYVRLDRKADAIAAFEKSLELNPENGNAIRRLEELKGGT